MYVTCPECGSSIYVHGRCWTCRCCGAEGCGLAGLEVGQSAETQSERPVNSPRRDEIKTLQVPS
jgi:hypothetical protein